MSVALMPTIRDVRIPKISRVRTSRPLWSVPSSPSLPPERESESSVSIAPSVRREYLPLMGKKMFCFSYQWKSESFEYHVPAVHIYPVEIASRKRIQGLFAHRCGPYYPYLFFRIGCYPAVRAKISGGSFPS